MAAKDRPRNPRRAAGRRAGAFRELVLRPERPEPPEAGLFVDRLAGFFAGGREREPEAREGRVEAREEPLAERARDVRGEADVRDAMGRRLRPNPTKHTRNTRTNHCSLFRRHSSGLTLGVSPRQSTQERGGSGFDDDRDDHRPAPVGGIDPPTHHPADALLEIVDILDPVG